MRDKFDYAGLMPPWLTTLGFEKAYTLETNEQRAARIEQQNRERDDELRRVPHQTVDKTKWPRTVRPISTSEADGLGIDPDGRLHWNGRPVEIIGRRIDLTRGQFWIAIVVATFTALGALGAIAQGWTAYHDWACRNGRPSVLSCPTTEPIRTRLANRTGALAGLKKRAEARLLILIPSALIFVIPMVLLSEWYSQGECINFSQRC
jgi:hypothetical protein